MSVTLCVLLWPHDGRADDLVAYEDAVLAFVAEHGGTVVQRARITVVDGAPLEVQLLTFPDEAALDAYMGDGRRLVLSADRDRAIARTDIWRTEAVAPSAP